MFQINKLYKFITISILIFLISSLLIVNCFASDGSISLIGNINDNSIEFINNNLTVFLDRLSKGIVDCNDLNNSDRWCSIKDYYSSFIDSSKNYDYKMIFYNKNSSGTYDLYIIKSNKKIEISTSPGIPIPYTSGNYSVMKVEYRFDSNGDFLPWLQSSFYSGTGNVNIGVYSIESDKVQKVNHNIYYINSNKLFYSYYIDIEDILFNLTKIINSFIICIVSCSSLLFVNSYFLFLALIFIALLIIKKLIGGEK